MYRTKKHAVYALLLVFLAAPVCGALLAPPIHRLLAFMADTHGNSAFWQWFGEKLSFHRVVSRCVMIMVLAVLYPAYRLSGIRNAASIGVTPDPRKWRLMGIGACLGILSMLLFYTPGFFIHVFECKATNATLAEQVGQVIVSTIGCILIGIIEEIFFRGFLNNLFQRILGFGAALLVGAATYSLIHFMKPSDPEDIHTWDAGLRTLALLFNRAGNSLPQQSLTLFGIGIVLTILFKYTKSLYVPIGIHIGWVWVMMMIDQFTSNPHDHWLYGKSEWLSKGWMGVAATAVFLIATLATKNYWKDLSKEHI